MEEVIVMKKRTCLVLVVSLMSLILAGGAAAKKKKLFLLDWIIYGKHAPFFAAKNFGFYKKQGLNIFYERGFGSGDTAKRIAAKVAPFGFADTGSVIGARVAGAKVVEVGMIHAKAPYAIYTLKNKQIRGVRDLKGYNFGSPKGNAARIMFPAFARKGGLNPGDVRWTTMKYGATLPSLLSGRVDAIVDYTTGGVTHMGKGRDAGKTVTEFRYTNVGFDVYSNGLIVHEDTIKQNPDMVRRWVKANMEAWGHCLIYTQKCLNNFYKYAPAMTKRLVNGHYIEALNLLIDEGVKRHGLGWMTRKKMNDTIGLVTKYTPLKRRIKTKDLYTNKFLPQAGK
jgi:NitT/TauT family transport system substrate-binding protein